MLKTGLGIAGALALVTGLALAFVAARDAAGARRAEQGLLARRDPAPPRFDPASLADLPEPVRRHLAHAIEPDTPLSTVVELQMEGTFLLGGRPLAMRATQVLAPPAAGFVWRGRFAGGGMRIAGSDGLAGATSWTRFGLFGLVPVARAGGDGDHLRSAQTRAFTEMVWVPAMLLPQNGARWEQTGPDSARVSHAALPDHPPLELTFDAGGAILDFSTLRWSNANPEGRYRLQPFGGRVLESRRFGGFTIPARIEVGNHYGTADFDRFFQATVTEARF